MGVMPRPPRVEYADALHHVTAASPSGRWLFHDDHDRSAYLALLGAQVGERGWQLFHFCLLGNHLHLLLRTPKPNLGQGIKAAHERYATHVNRRRGERGHVFGARFYNGVVVHQRHFDACMRYIARNPVEAGLCRAAHEWPWSAHNALVGTVAAPGFLEVDGALSLMEGRAVYQQLVSQPDLAVLATLQASTPGDGWLVDAVVGHHIELATIMDFTGWSRATTYRRLRAARETGGSGP